MRNAWRADVHFGVKSGHGKQSGRCPLYPPKADIADAMRNVRFVPKPDIAGFLDRWRDNSKLLKAAFGGLAVNKTGKYDRPPIMYCGEEAR